MTAIEIPTPDPRTFDDSTRPFAEAVSRHFAVKRMIGRGGMGMVFLARDKRLDRLVAIKTLPPSLAKDAAVRERFLRETRTAGSMAHPNVVPIHGADEIEGHVFFVMSYIDGASLAALTRAKGLLEPTAVARYMRDVASALVHAHGRGIIHRDIKAENILIERSSDRALVTDFGIARLAEASPLTVTGQVLGTVHYVSPEQVSGETVDVRSDIYSLGIVGFFALTGQFPFDGDLASAVMLQHVTRTAPPVASVNRNVPTALAALIDRCLMKDPAHRFSTAADLLGAIDAAIPTLDARPVVVSDTEAHAVWKRAAELQAQTGIQPRPEPVAQPRPAAKENYRGPGFDVGEVVAAAAEAGIDERYVEHALVEKGLAAKPAARESRTFRSERRAMWGTASIDIMPDVVLEAELGGELPAADVERLVNLLRDHTGTMGQTIASTRELAWLAHDWQSRLTVSVVPREGRTTITLKRTMRGIAGAIVLGSVAIGGALGMVAGMLAEEIVRHSDELAFLVGIAATVTFAFAAGRLLVRHYRRQAAKHLDLLADALIAKIRERL
jgi:serine/threonine-protein kinase